MSGEGDGADKADGGSSKPPPVVLGKDPAFPWSNESDPDLLEELSDEDVAGVVDKSKGKMVAGEGSSNFRGKGKIAAEEASSEGSAPKHRKAGGSPTRKGALGGWIVNPKASPPTLDPEFMQRAAIYGQILGLNLMRADPPQPPRPGAPICHSCDMAEATTALYSKDSHSCLCDPCVAYLADYDPVVVPCQVCLIEYCKTFAAKVKKGNAGGSAVPQAVVPGVGVGLVVPRILCLGCNNDEATTSLILNGSHRCLCTRCLKIVVEVPHLTPCKECQDARGESFSKPT